LFTNLTIENLRSITRLEIERLGQVNLVTGRNSAGKTTVLEALWLLASPGHPGNAIRLNGFRGMNIVEIREALGSESPWASLFPTYDTSRAIRIAATLRGDGRESRRAVTLREVAGSTTALSTGDLVANGGSSSIATRPDLTMTVEGYSGFDAEYRILFGLAGAEEAPKAPPVPLRAIFLHARTDESVEAMAQRYSELVAGGREATIVDALRLIDPTILGLRLLTAGAQAVVHADVGGPHLIALPLMGGGTWRLFAIVVALLWCGKGGLLLLDEAEYGVHFSVLPKLWRTIDRLAREHRVQVVATTHSRECVEAAFEAQESKLVTDRDEFVFMRMNRDSAGVVSAVSYDSGTLRAALEGDLEVR